MKEKETRERDKLVNEEEGRRRKTRRIVARVCVIYVLIRCYRVKAPWPTYTRCVACPYYASLQRVLRARLSHRWATHAPHASCRCNRA